MPETLARGSFTRGIDSPFRAWNRSVFFSANQQVTIVAATAHLGSHLDSAPINADLWLVHFRDRGWRHGGWRARDPYSPISTDSRTLDRIKCFTIGCDDHARQTGDFHDGIGLSLDVRRNSALCPARSVDLSAGCWAKWQAECNLDATGWLFTGDGEAKVPFQGSGYSSFMRGKWDLTTAPAWIALLAGSQEAQSPDHYGIAFLLAQPHDRPTDHECAVVVWRNKRLVKTFSRRHLKVFASDFLDHGDVEVVPFLVSLLPVNAAASVPKNLWIEGGSGDSWLQIAFQARRGARIIFPSETGNIPGLSHQIFGEVDVSLRLNGARAHFRTETIAEFGGGMAAGEQS